MSDVTASAETFASGRYSKRKRTQVTYHLEEMEVSDAESDFEGPQSKKHKAKPTPRPLPKRKIFPFMELPAELRNMIYAYALTDPSGIGLVAAFKHKRRTVERVSADCASTIDSRCYRSRNFNNQKPAPLIPSVLAVNKQIYKEGVDMLYDNEFIFADSAALYSFLLNLGPTGSKYVKTIRLMEWGYGRGAMKACNHACFAVLVWATNLTTFHLESDPGAGQFYRDAFPWLEAFGMAKSRPDAAVDILHLGDDFLNQAFDTTSSDGELEEDFKMALRRLLGEQQKRVMGAPVKKKKKVGKEAVADEL